MIMIVCEYIYMSICKRINKIQPLKSHHFELNVETAINFMIKTFQCINVLSDDLSELLVLLL